MTARIQHRHAGSEHQALRAVVYLADRRGAASRLAVGVLAAGGLEPVPVVGDTVKFGRGGQREDGVHLRLYHGPLCA